MVDFTGFIFRSIIIIAVIVALFAILDRVLKGGTKKAEKKPEEKKPEPKPAPAPVQPISKLEPEVVQKPTMQIYNSELADDLNEILKKTETDNTVRLKIENHVHKESNVAKYIKSKNYRNFDFGTEENTEEKEEPMTFTIEDYKRIMALSNIDDKK